VAVELALEQSRIHHRSRGHLGGDGLPRDISCFRLMLPKGSLFSEEGPEIRSVVVAEVRRIEGWLPDNFELASNVLDPSANAQQPEPTHFSPMLWDWDADGFKGTAGRLEQLCVNAQLVQPSRALPQSTRCWPP
jgi:hypothetical protein